MNHPVQEVIRKHLVALAEDLGRFEQTTHGVMFSRGIESVAKYLNDCYNSCSSYDISSLSQHIRLLEKEKMK